MRYILSTIIVSLFLFSCVKDRVKAPAVPTQQRPVNVGSRVLIDYWNFNNNSTLASLVAPTFTIGGGALIIDADSTDSYVPSPALTTPTPNAQNGDTTGSLLRVRNPSTDLIIAAPTTGYKNVLISYAVATSSSTSGVLTDSVFYTTDGTNYINTGLSVVTYSVPVDPAYVLETFDLSSITAVNNNAHFKFKITFSNGNLGAKGNTRFDNITVNADSLNATGSNPPVISSASTASGIVGTTFTYNIIASATPTSYAVTNLPAGLTVNTATGVISGTPTTAGTFIDTLKATNAAGIGVRVLTITIAAPPVPVISSASTASGTVGTAFTYSIAASNTPTSYAVGGTLPLGLTINTSTGVISGTPTTAGTVIDTVKAINAFGTGTLVLTFTITAATPVLLDYWNFNNNTSLATLITPTSTINGASLAFDFIGAPTSSSAFYDSVASTATSQNAQNGDLDGDALRVRNPSLDMIITAPTTGYKNIIFSFAEDASSASKAALIDSIYYTTDGTTYNSLSPAATTFALSSYIDPNYGLASFDFSSITAANDNANFKIKIVFTDGNTNTSGNDRFDNMTLVGVAK